MKWKVLSYKKEKSHYGGECLVMFFKAEDGTSAKTWLYPKNGNFKRWEPVIRKVDGRKEGEEVFIDGVRQKSKSLIDADSQIRFAA